MELQDGEIIADRYLLEGKIGEGGMASVWRARDQTLERPVAVKFLYARDVRHRKSLKENFLREARIAAAIRHRNVVDILDFGTHRSTTPYMVMELLEGESFGGLLERSPRLPAPQVVDILAHALEGLIAVHEAGIVHRDLKPDNIFLVRERTRVFPKLLDFGISRSLDPDTGPRSALTTQDGRIVGTPEYMSPEQARGLRDIDVRTDIYSLGVIMYEGLTGRLPFESAGVGDLIVKIVQADYPTVQELAPDVSSALSAFVAKAMHRDREQRFANAEEMHRALLGAAESALGTSFAHLLSLPPPVKEGGHSSTVLSHTAHTAAEPSGAAGRGPVSRVHARAPTTAGEPLRLRPWLLGAAAFALAAGALGALMSWGDVSSLVSSGAPGASTASSEPRFIVVQGGGEPQGASSDVTLAKAAGGGPPAAEETTAGEPARKGAAGEAAIAVTKSETEDDEQPHTPAADIPDREPNASKKRASKRARRPAAALARTFAQHASEITKCFDAAADEDIPSLSVRLTLRKSGDVSEAQMSPANYAATPAGKCVLGVARAIRFGPQKQELSFRVPLTVRRGT